MSKSPVPQPLRYLKPERGKPTTEINSRRIEVKGKRKEIARTNVVKNRQAEESENRKNDVHHLHIFPSLERFSLFPIFHLFARRFFKDPFF